MSDLPVGSPSSSSTPAKGKGRAVAEVQVLAAEMILIEKSTTLRRRCQAEHQGFQNRRRQASHPTHRRHIMIRVHAFEHTRSTLLRLTNTVDVVHERGTRPALFAEAPALALQQSPELAQSVEDFEGRLTAWWTISATVRPCGHC